MAAEQQATKRILGLDLGVNSVGWALIERNGATGRILRTGVRIFDAGVDEQKFAQGRPASHATDRRTARLMRRQTERRARRARKLCNLLQQAGLLPAGSPPDVLPELDKRLLADALRATDLSAEERARLPHVLPYWLRKHALDHKIEKHALGRALYHLGQRRGFLTNRKAPEKKDEEVGKVKAGISTLRTEMAAAGARTLGEFFASVNPEQRRIRNQYTQRDMFTTEFDLIWSAQAAHYPDVLTDALKEEVRKAMFFQRPLRSAKGLVGTCEFERGARRVALARLNAQRFRLLQTVNNAEISGPGVIARRLTEQERGKLIGKLEADGDVTFAGARRLLGLPKNYQFNLEEGGAKGFIGNRTNQKLTKVFGERWMMMAVEDQEAVIEDLLSIHKDATLITRGQKKWGLSAEDAVKLADVSLEDGYANLSRRAILKLLPHMERGDTYGEAADKVYGEAIRSRAKALDRLPPVNIAMPHLRNPAVCRILTELRKVVNALIATEGKPDIVRIELARDLRRNAKQREDSSKRMRGNEKRREDAAADIERDAPVVDPSPRDIEKALLWKECNGVCPYTGKAISFASLFGPEPEFDIEHIIPLSRSLDDSFLNKTLCDVRENRERKGNKTPWETYGSDETRWNEILQSVRRFKGDAANEKLRRFLLQELPEPGELATVQLNDTRYASKQAVQFLGLLYGGTYDAQGKRVTASKGGITAFLRSEWGLNRLFGNPDDGRKTKSRDDHRHHSVDAIVTALTDERAVQLLSEAAVRAAQQGRRRFAAMDSPWDGFDEEARRVVGGIVVSHRLDRRVNGRMHQDTVYSPPKANSDGKQMTRVRTKLESFNNEKDVEAIADPIVRSAVKNKLAELGGDFKKFKDPANHPHLAAGDGRKIPIHSVRLITSATTFRVGAGPRERNVCTDTNHHMEIVEEQTRKGPVWRGIVVDRLEAMRRKSKAESIVKRDHGADKKFLFTLHFGDLIEVDGPVGRRILRVRGISEGQLELVTISDARQMTELRALRQRIRPTPDGLRKWNCSKVIVTPLGEIRRAND